jgi:hypothetical protein
MKVKELIKNNSLKCFAEGDFEKEIESGYSGDFLSNTISRAGDNCIWFTVMNNVNVAAVALLIDCAVICLCENVEPDKAFLEKAKNEKINIIGTQLDVYSAIKKFEI